MCGSKPTDALRTLPERAFRLRARLIAVGLCAVCFAGLIGRLFWLQLCTGGWYTQRALGQQLRDTVVPADRGKIYSADGALLAANSSCWTLRASPREMPEEKLALAAKGLAEILELDEAKLLEKFNDRRSNDCLLRYRVERETADAVRDFCAENDITGVRINQDSKRWYPQGEFLASVLGFTNVDNAGVSGLELEYNDTLTGQNGVVLTAVNAWGYTLAQSYETELAPVEGSGLRLTIDANIQHYLENALNYAVQEHHVAARSVGIVMEVNTGAVLAMATTPAYDPNQPRVIADKAARAAVDALSGRSEFYTSYTPYQAECSQGTLQAIFEYQTAVSRLLDMDCANASVYDGGTALFEACMMAVRATRRKKLVVDQCINPVWRAMLETYSSSLDITLVTVPHKDGLSDMEGLKAAVDATCAAVLVQNPNFFGAVADFSELFAHARACKALGVISVYPVMQSVLKTPGEMGADIAVAEGQSLGQPLSFGGPYLGIMTCRKEHIRQFPGRIVGRTTDLEGRTGYVLTLQAREQHIRRAKATSNICSNQSLCALRALMYLSLVGPDGLTRVAEHGMALARYAVEKLTALPGVSLLNDAPFGNEVALRLPRPAEEVVQALLRQGVAAGYPVGRAYAGMDDVLLLACTECNTRTQVDAMVEKLGGLL